MTDNERMEVFEYKVKILCDICDIKDKECCETCVLGLAKQALDLNNRQKAEIDILIRKKDTLRDEIAEQQAYIERLKGHISHTNNVVKQVVEDTKFKAIQEFAERLKAEVAHIPAWGSVAEKKIDNLVKEMVGESNV